MDDAERRQRDLELLMRSRRALEDQRVGRDEPGDTPAAAPSRSIPEPTTPAHDVVMYRGKPVNRPAARPAMSSVQPPPTPGKVDLTEALKRLGELHAQGLISRSEYDKKRLQILDRL